MLDDSRVHHVINSTYVFGAQAWSAGTLAQLLRQPGPNRQAQQQLVINYTFRAARVHR
jgi:hypothetical protein